MLRHIIRNIMHSCPPGQFYKLRKLKERAVFIIIIIIMPHRMMGNVILSLKHNSS